MYKRKHSPDWIIARVEEYLDGQGSYRSMARTYGIGEATLFAWVKKYKEQGAECFAEQEAVREYSKEFKVQCVEAVIRGEGSVDEIVAR